MQWHNQGLVKIQMELGGSSWTIDTAAQLLILLREQYDILGSGTTRANRIGWPKEQMNLSKADERGTSKVLYDRQNEILAVQWVDSKVVSCTSTRYKYLARLL